MRLIRNKRFKKDYKKLPPDIQKQTDKKLDFLLEDYNHPSLRTKRVLKCKGIFEASITKDYRFLFLVDSDAYILIRVGKHDILDKL